MRISRLFGLVQSVVILLLLVLMSEEYSHNQFFQAWAEVRLGILSFFLNGTLAVLYAALVTAYYVTVPEEETRPMVEKRESIVAEAEATT